MKKQVAANRKISPEGYPMCEKDLLVLGKADTLTELKSMIAKEYGADGFDEGYELVDFRVWQKGSDWDPHLVVIKCGRRWAYGIPEDWIAAWEEKQAEEEERRRHFEAASYCGFADVIPDRYTWY